MQHGHPVEAVQEYSSAVKNIMALKGKWQEAQGGESNRVLATILYLQAKAKIEGEGVVLDAMQELQTVLHKHSFPAVHLELAHCHIHLNRCVRVCVRACMCACFCVSVCLCVPMHVFINVIFLPLLVPFQFQIQRCRAGIVSRPHPDAKLP